MPKGVILVRKVSVLQFAVGVILGAGIWVVLPYLTGQKEAWDSNWLYVWSLLISGFVGGVLDPPRCWVAAIGVLVGQTLAFVTIILFSEHRGALWPIGLFYFLPLYSLVSLFGVCLGAVAGVIVRIVFVAGRRLIKGDRRNVEI